MSAVWSARRKLNPHTSTKNKKKYEQKHDPRLHHYMIEDWVYLCATVENCSCLPLEASVRVYLYHSTEHFRPQSPHRKELKAWHHWWHNQAPEWNCIPRGSGAFRHRWNYTTRSHCRPMHTQKGAYFIPADTQILADTHCGVWVNCRVLSCFWFYHHAFFSHTITS